MYASWILYLYRVLETSMSIIDRSISATNAAEIEYYLVLTYIHRNEKVKISSLYAGDCSYVTRVCNMQEKENEKKKILY